MTALESTGAGRSVRRSVPLHKDRAPVALCTVDPSDVRPAAELIARRVRANQRGKAAGSMVFVDDHMSVYVLNDTQSVAMAWVQTRLRWLVACYLPSRPIPGVPFSEDDVAGDLQSHIADLGFAP